MTNYNPFRYILFAEDNECLLNHGVHNSAICYPWYSIYTLRLFTVSQSCFNSFLRKSICHTSVTTVWWLMLFFDNGHESKCIVRSLFVTKSLGIAVCVVFLIILLEIELFCLFAVFTVFCQFVCYNNYEVSGEN